MDTQTEHRIIYLGVGVVAIALLIWGVIAFEHRQDSDEARNKADELVEAYKSVDLPTPENTDQIVATLGTDGGQVCATATDDLSQALFKLHTFLNASKPGASPVTLDRDVVEGGALIIEVYCPDMLDDYLEFINEDLDTDDGVIDFD